MVMVSAVQPVNKGNPKEIKIVILLDKCSF